MTSGQLIAILLITLSALALILYPLWRRRAAGHDAVGTAATADRTSELQEEKATVYRALKELEFDHEAGYVSDEDYRASRERYEARAAEIVHALDELPPALVEAGPRVGSGPGTVIAGTRRARYPLALAAGVALLLGVGVVVGLLVGRSRTREPATPLTSILTSGERERPPATAPLPPSGEPSPRGEPQSRAALGGMLEAALQHLRQGRYKDAMAGYQAVLRQEPGNVDALTHIGLILAIGGHADSAIESLDKITKSNPNYSPAYFYRGQVLYHAKQDYAGAIRDWERYLALVPAGKDHDDVVEFIKEARARQRQ